MEKDEKIARPASCDARVSNSLRTEHFVQTEKRLVPSKNGFKFLRF